MASLFLSFQEELNSVKALIQREVVFKAAKFEELVPMTTNELDENLCPAILLAASRACGYAGKQAVAMGAILQFVFMADRIHRLMRDDEDIDEDMRQFPVLVGDFLYGKFFLGLCREKLLVYLAPIARSIENMSKGTISRWLTRSEKLDPEDYLTFLEQERGSLTGLAARIGADLGGASVNLQESCERFGRQLGLAWAAWQERMESNIIVGILNGAAEILTELPDTPQFQPMHELYQYTAGHLIPQG